MSFRGKSVICSFICVLCLHLYLARCQKVSSAFPKNGDAPMMTICPRHCACEATVAGLAVDCSNKKLTEVPSNLPAETRILILHSNRIGVLKNSDFQNLKNLTTLDLAHNNINVTEDNPFFALENLRSLNLSYNRLPSLKVGFFSSLTRLSVLNMGGTRLQFNPEAFINVTSLETLEWSNNRQQRFPNFLHHNKSLFPRLTELYLARNSLNTFYHHGLDSLEVLSLGLNQIRTIFGNAVLKFKNLRYLNLYENELRIIHRKGLCSETLRKLDLSFSRFALTAKTRNVFNCIPSLEELSLISCKISSVRHTFQKLGRLRKLNLGSTGISDQNVYFLLHDVTSLEWLSLQDNSIHELKANMFKPFSNTLKVLEIGSNSITTVNYSSFPPVLWHSLEKLDLSSNPYNCDCQLLWFLHWLRTTNVTISHWKDKAQYKCSAPAKESGTALAKLKHITEAECFSAETDWLLLTVFLAVLVVCSSSTGWSLLYRFRWYARYWYFKYRIQKRQDQQSSADSRCYLYDAFVSYCHQDSKWVVGKLREHLETDFGLQLCIHDRDFLVGEDIADNVIQSIEDSRKVILIVSNAFALSHWCHFELVMVQTRIMESDQDNFVLILLEEVHKDNLPPRLKLQMEKQTYLEWTDSAVGQQLFWARLRQALRRPSHSITDSLPPREMFGLPCS